MKATSSKAILLAASLIFPALGFAQTTSKGAAAYANRGIAELKSSDWDRAIADFNRALQVDPKLAPAYANRGLARARKGDLDGAIADYNRALQLDPKNAKAYDNRGIAKLERGDLVGAIADFNRALQFDPKLAPAYETRGVAKVQKGDLDGAIADCDRALELNPKLAGAYVDRGSAKLLKADADRAIADFNRALELNPKLVGAYDGRGSANFLARNWTAALREYRRFCELWQRDQEYTRLAIWMIRSRLGEREAADKELATRFTAAPGSWVSKVKAYLLGNLSEADFLAAAASPDANTDRGQHCEAWFFAGMKNLLNGDKRAAAEFFKKCLATEQKSEIEYHFAQAELKALGQ